MLKNDIVEQARAVSFAAYIELTKPKVVSLIVFTAVVGMLLATTVIVEDGQVIAAGVLPLRVLFFGTLGIGLAASSAAVINHILDRRADAQMARTRRRPIPTGHISERQAAIFAFILGAISMIVLTVFVNPLTAILTFLSLIGYAVVYTRFLKRATPQNIVIGGAAGAAPPVLGWVAVTNDVHAHALLLFLIIFTWTPPHFWALAIARREEYAKAGIPMLPVTHGVEFTQLQIQFYTILLLVVSILPYLTGMSGLLYLVVALILGGRFLFYAIALRRSQRKDLPMRVFAYSVTYLIILFAALLLDHYLPLLSAVVS